MKPQSKTDWERVKREAAADVPVPHDVGDPYDPDNDAAVNAYWAEGAVTHGGRTEPFHSVSRRVRGEQKAPKKVATAIRLSPEVVDYFKSGGPGWQTRVDEALQEWVKTHKAA